MSMLITIKSRMQSRSKLTRSP